MTTKHFFYTVGIIISFVFSSCKNVINQDDKLKEILVENNLNKSSFTLYNYTNEQFFFSDFNLYKDSFFQIDQFSHFLSSLLLIEKGIIFNESTKYPVGNKELSLLEAFQQNDTSFFNYYLNKVERNYFFNLVETLKISNNIDVDTTLSINRLLQTASLNSDQIMGFISKFYFKKLNFQDRTYDIVKSLIKKDSLSTMNIHSMQFKIDKKQKLMQIGWIEKDLKPYFFLYLLEKNVTKENQHKVFKQLLQSLNLITIK